MVNGVETRGVVGQRAGEGLAREGQQRPALPRAQTLHRTIERDPRLAQGLEQSPTFATSLGAVERQQSAVVERASRREERVGVGLDADAAARAVGAGALPAVEGEEARVEGREPEAAGRAEETLGVEALLAARLDRHRAVPEPQRSAEGVLERRRARHEIGRHHQVDVVLAVAVEQTHAGERDAGAVDARLAQAQLARARQDLLVVALAPAHHRREQRHRVVAPLLADAVEDLPAGLGADGRFALRAVLHAELGEQQAQVVRDLGHRGDGRGAAAARQTLLDRDGGRQARDHVDVGLGHHVQELPGVGRQAVEVAALPFGVEHVERQRRLARSGEAGEDDQPVARQLERDVAQVVLARAGDADGGQADAGRRPPRERGLRGAIGAGRQRVAQEHAGGRPQLGHPLGRPFGDHAATCRAALGTQLDHPVGARDDVEVVLDDEERVAALDQAREAGEQALDVGGMEAGRGLVEEEEGVGARVSAEMGRQLDALGLAARERRQRLAEPQVLEPDVGQGLQAAAHVLHVGERLERLGDRQVEHVADAATLPAHLEDLGLEARPVALARTARRRRRGTASRCARSRRRCTSRSARRRR